MCNASAMCSAATASTVSKESGPRAVLSFWTSSSGRGVTPRSWATSAIVRPSRAISLEPTTSATPTTLTSGSATVAKPPGTTRNRIVPLASYCGPAISSSATACSDSRVSTLMGPSVPREEARVERGC